jgi:hypothetical protein
MFAISRLARPLKRERAMRLAFVLLFVVACRPPGYGKEGGEPDAGVDAGDVADPDAAAPSPDAAPDAEAVTCEKTFRLEGHEAATSVWVTGDFTGWAGTPADGAIALALGGDGAWSGNRTFDAGMYQYKLILDGSTWIVDPANPETIDDGLGGQNSVLRCE